MAENILRLRVDSTEYDNKLKSATTAISRYWDALASGRNNLNSTRAELLKYVQSLGTMETKSTTVKGRIAELSKAYLELKSRYNQLSDTARQSDVGRAMAASLDQIAQRAINAREELAELNRQIGDTGGNNLQSLTNGLNNLNGILSGGISGITGMISKAGPYGAAAAGVLTLGGAIASLGSDAIEARKNLENLEVNIGTLLGSAQKGRDLVAELQQYGVKTPYDTEGLAGAARTMLAYGVSAQQIMPIMRQLGDIAQGNTQNLQSLALAFGQMTAVGTVQKQDLNQMANAGFGFNQIAKSMGVTVAEFLDMVSKKKVSVDDIAKALNDATSAGGLFYKSAENASKGLEGTFSNFEESLTNTKAKLGALIEPAVIEVVNSLGTAVEGLTAGLGGSQQAAEAFTTVGKALGVMIQGLSTYISDIISVGENFISIMDEIGGVVNTLLSPIKNLTGNINGLQSEFDRANASPLINAVEGLFSPIRQLNTLLQTTLGLIVKAKTALTGEKNNSGHPGWTDQQVIASQNAAIRQGRAKYTMRHGQRFFTDMEGNTRGHHRYFAQEGRWKRLTYDVANATWPYVDDPTYNPGGNKNSSTPKTPRTQTSNSSSRRTTSGRRSGRTARTSTPKTEEQFNNERINKLSDEYVKATDTRRSAIKAEIETLQKRNDEIKKLKEEAQGKVEVPIDPDSLKGLNEQLSELKSKQDLSKTNEEWQEWQEKIDGAKKKIEDITHTDVDLSGLTGQNISNFTANLQKQIQEAPIGSALYDSLTSQLRSVSTFSDILSETIKAGLSPDKFGDMSELWNQILAGEPVDEALQTLVDKINEKFSEMELPQFKIDATQGGLVKDGDNAAKSWTKAGQAIQSVGNAMQAIEDPTAKILGSIAQAIASVALGAGEAIAKGGKLGPWGWIAAAASVTAAMVSTIATIRSATSHAQGGIIEGGVVGGSSYSGDRVLTRLNSGELVLNRAQQGNLASQLEATNGNYGNASSYVSGENIYIALNTYMRRRGIGELAAFKFK